MVLDQRKPLTYIPDIVFLTKEHGQRPRVGRLWGQRIRAWNSNHLATGHG